MLRATEGSGCRHTEGSMAARTPEDLDRLFTEHMAAGDVDAIVALYEPGGVLVSAEGVPTTGHAAIRAAVDDHRLQGQLGVRAAGARGDLRAGGDSRRVVVARHRLSAVRQP